MYGSGASDCYLGVIARVTVILTVILNYGAIAAQMDDLKQCAREALREGVGSSSLIGA